MADLRNELKEWERTFRAAHGRAPTKDDIRLQPSIAAKYKEYNKLRAGAGKGADKPSSSRTTPSSRPPPPAPSTTAAAESSHIFKTPTKPKSARTRPRHDDVSSSTDGPAPPTDASPSKRLSSSRDKPSSSTSFIHANSPSKLRALAAAHSTSGSPNRPTSGAWASATLAPSDSLPVTGLSASPQRRAHNPFASPQKGTFGELERAERERLKAKKRAERERARAGGVLGSKATSRGAGWGGASTIPDGGAGRTFSRIDSVGSARGMDVDEVDDFFSSQSSLAPSTQAPSQSQGSQRLLAQLAKASPVRPVAADDDDEVFGPSPVKRPSASNPLFGLSPSSSSAAAPAPKRIFKPLVPDSPPPSRPASSAAPAATAAPTKPKPFSSSLPSSFLPPVPAASRKRVPAPGDGDDDRDAADAALDDGDDDFYADALDEAESGAAKGNGRAKKGAAAARGRGEAAAAPAKRKKVAAAAGAGARKTGSRAKGKGKAGADDSASSSDGAEMDVEEGEDDDEVRIVSSSRARGELVLDVSRDPALGLGTGRERLVIHEKGYEARVRALEREERRRRAEERAREAGEEKEEGDEAAALDAQQAASEEEDDAVGDEASLFHRRAGLDLLSRLRADAASTSAALTASTAADDNNSAAADELSASLPADLAAVLSLRASPQKAHSAALAKQRQVARLLGEPVAGGHRRRQKGLLGLDEGEVEEGDGEGVGDEEGEGDDDWDEEPDGWKATADAMDGYYSADGW
ncbi:hypothetical protein JCM9279_001827 [Rhodotorula babjevae]